VQLMHPWLWNQWYFTLQEYMHEITLMLYKLIVSIMQSMIVERIRY
jgi:type IV secretory pathway TraG/TraD family ATPase VirD4